MEEHYKLIVQLMEKGRTTSVVDPVTLEVKPKTNHEYFVFTGQVIPDHDIPERIYGASPDGLEVFDRYIVSYDPATSTVIQVMEHRDPDAWLANEIVDVNKHNKSLHGRIGAGNQKRKIIPIPEDLFIPEMTWELIVATVKMGEYPLMTGPTGSGKTVCARSIAKALGMDYYYLNCGQLSKPKQTLVGTVHAKDGSTFLVESEFLTYFSSDKPTIIFLDEISRIPGQAENFMMTILDKEQEYIYVEELAKRIYKGKHVIFIAAANFGIQYVSTRPLDVAFLDRFIPFHLNYLSPAEEVKLVMMKQPGIKQADVEKLVKTANKIRQNRESIGQDLSHRNVIKLAGYLRFGFTLGEVLEYVLINIFVNGSDDRREQVQQILNS